MAGNKCGQLALIRALANHQKITSILELEGIERSFGMPIGHQRTDTELMRILAELGRIEKFNIALIIIDAHSGVQKANSVISGISIDPTAYLVISHIGDAHGGHYEPILDASTILAHTEHSAELQAANTEPPSNSDELDLVLAISESLAYEKCPPPEEDQALAIAMSESLAASLAPSVAPSVVFNPSAEEFHTLDEDLALAMAMSLSLSLQSA